MKQEGTAPLPDKQGLFKGFKSVKLLSSLTAFFTIFICFLGLGAFNQTLAATYYVDNTITDTHPASGTPDCTNYNTSTLACSGGSNSAYATISDVNAGSFSHGDQILFRRGQTWRETLWISSDSGSAGNPITYGAFGSGAKPVISGADVKSGFTNGGSNIWNKVGITTQPTAVWFNGVRGNLKTSIPSLTTNNDWYWTSNTLYIYSDTDPSGKSIEAGNRNWVIYVSDVSYITLNNLGVTKSNDDSGIKFYANTTNMTEFTVDNCTSSDNYGQYGSGIGIDGGTHKITNTTLTNNILYGNGDDGINIGPGVNDVIIEHNKIYNNSSNSLSDLNPDDPTGGIYIFGNNIDANNLTIRYNESYQNTSNTGWAQGTGMWLDSVGSNVIVAYNNIHDNDWVGLGIEKSPNEVQIYYNQVYDNNKNPAAPTDGNTGGIVVYRGTSGAKVYNNLSYNNITGIFVNGGTGSGGPTSNNQIINNISYGNTKYQLATWNGGDNDGTNGSGNIYNYNLFGPERASFIRWGASHSEVDTYSVWETAYCGSSGCSHSLNTNPSFVAGGDAKPYPYFYPRSYSPVINAGTDVGLTKDYLGTSVPQAATPDIGAFEYTVSIPENIWFFFPLFMALPRLIFILSNSQDWRLFLALLKKRRYHAVLRELYLPYLNLVYSLTRRSN